MTRLLLLLLFLSWTFPEFEFHFGSDEHCVFVRFLVLGLLIRLYF